MRYAIFAGLWLKALAETLEEARLIAAGCGGDVFDWTERRWVERGHAR